VIDILQRYRKLIHEASNEIECTRSDGCLHCRLVDASKRYVNPSVDGLYLLLSYEWIGTPEDKPKRPYWQIRRYWASSGWEHRRWGVDTGGYDNFEAVMWEPLPNYEAL
jgi:hypothetical protein